jgi:hypothetical protein
MNIIILRGDQNYGPYTLEQVRHYVGNASLSENDLAWHEGCVDWLPLKNIINPSKVPPVPPPQVPAEKKYIEKRSAIKSQLNEGVGLSLFLLCLAIASYAIGFKLIADIMFAICLLCLFLVILGFIVINVVKKK